MVTMIKRKDVLAFFEENGFENRGGRNHDLLLHPDGRRTVLGRHREISNVMFEEMKKQAGILRARRRRE